MSLKAAESLNSITGQWQMIEEYGEKQPQNEILSFSENGYFSAKGIQCGRYFLSDSSLSLVTGKYGRETEISLKWKKVQDNLLLTPSTFEKANSYKQISSIADSCNITKDWKIINEQGISFLIPKDWIYKIEKQANDQHYRIMFANVNNQKTIILMLTKLLNQQEPSALNLDQLLLKMFQEITRNSPYPSSLIQDKTRHFPEYTLKQGTLYYGLNNPYKVFASTGKINDWKIISIITQSTDQLNEIPQILESITFENNKLTNE